MNLPRTGIMFCRIDVNVLRLMNSLHNSLYNGVTTMTKHFDYTTYNVTFLDDTFGLKTLTFNSKECAEDFANDLVFKQCDFIHLYQSQVSTIYLKDESVLYVQNFK